MNHRIVHLIAASKMARNPLSVVLAYGVTRTVRRDRIDLGGSRWIVDPASDAFLAQCGEAFVAGQDVGGIYAVVFTFHFEDREALDDFEAKVGREVAVWDLFPRIAQNVGLLGGRTVLSGYSVLQRGGEPRLGIPGVAAEDALGCGLYQGVVSCATVANALVTFVTTSDTGGYLASVARQPSPLGNRLRPWSEVSAAPPPRALPLGVALARNRLHRLHEAQLARTERLVVAARFPGLDLLPSERALLEQGVRVNEVVARVALQRCYRSEVAFTGAAQDDCILGAMDESLRSNGFDPALSLLPLGLP